MKFQQNISNWLFQKSFSQKDQGKKKKRKKSILQVSEVPALVLFYVQMAYDNIPNI